MSLAINMESVARMPTAMEMAIQLVRESYRQLGSEDRKDVNELLAELAQARDANAIEDIFDALRELLDTKPQEVFTVPLDKIGDTNGIENWMSYIATRVKKAREEAGLTQLQLAEITGIQQAHLSRIENAQHSPTHRTLMKIAKALKKEVEYFNLNDDNA